MTNYKTMSLMEYLKVKDEEGYSPRCSVVKLIDPNNITNSRLPAFPFTHVDLDPETVSGTDYVIPTYFKTDVSRNIYLETNKSPLPIVDNFIVEVDMVRNELENNPGQVVRVNQTYIRMDDYLVEDTQHWLSRAVLLFLKDVESKRKVLLTVDKMKSIKILKKLVEGEPIEYKKILQLFGFLGISDTDFEKYIKTLS